MSTRYLEIGKNLVESLVSGNPFIYDRIVYIESLTDDGTKRCILAYMGSLLMQLDNRLQTIEECIDPEKRIVREQAEQRVAEADAVRQQQLEDRRQAQRLMTISMAVLKKRLRAYLQPVDKEEKTLFASESLTYQVWLQFPTPPSLEQVEQLDLAMIDWQSLKLGPKSRQRLECMLNRLVNDI